MTRCESRLSETVTEPRLVSRGLDATPEGSLMGIKLVASITTVLAMMSVPQLGARLCFGESCFEHSVQTGYVGGSGRATSGRTTGLDR